MELYSTTDFLRDLYNRTPDEDKPEMLEMYKQAMKKVFENDDTAIEVENDRRR